MRSLAATHTGVLTGVSGDVSCIALCRRTISARNSAPLLSLTLGTELDFEDLLATGVRILYGNSGPGGDRLCDRLGLGSWMEEEGEYEGTGANEMLLEAASSVNKYWSLGFSDVFSAAGLCDRLLACGGGVTDGIWPVQAGVP